MTELLELAGDRLLAASAVAAVLALGVAALVRLAPSLPAALRAGLWWLVAARTLIELAGVPGAELAVLPSPWTPQRTAISAPADGGARSLDAASAPEPATAGRAIPAEGFGGALRWLALVASALAALAAARGLRQIAVARRRVRSSTPVRDPDCLARFERLREVLGVRRPVALALSTEAETPQVVGLLRPTILLPDSAALGRDELDWALAHELAHVRRFDALWSLVPFAAERLLVFHPGVRWAAREYALATEAACDAEVLRRCAPAADRYGRLLVRLAAGPLTTPAPAAAWPLARRPLERRLEMLHRTLTRPRPALVALGGALLLALAIAVPVRLVAQAPEPPPAPAAPELASPEAPEAPEAPRAPEAKPAAPAAPTAPSAPSRPHRARPPIAPTAPVVVAPAAGWSDATRRDLERQLEAARAGAEKARQAVESSRAEVERARLAAQLAQRQAEQPTHEELVAQHARQEELQAEMERLREQLFELQEELERTHAELAEGLGAEMERLHEELEREFGPGSELDLELGPESEPEIDAESDTELDRELELEAGERFRRESDERAEPPR